MQVPSRHCSSGQWDAVVFSASAASVVVSRRVASVSAASSGSTASVVELSAVASSVGGTLCYCMGDLYWIMYL